MRNPAQAQPGKKQRREEDEGDQMTDEKPEDPQQETPHGHEAAPPPSTNRGETEDMDVGWCIVEDWGSMENQPSILIIDSGTGKYRSPHDVSEVFSPPRVTVEARKMNMSGGWALDMTTTDDEGKIWDFDDPKMRSKARKLVKESKPLLLIGSPECTAFSQLQYMNKDRYQDPEKAAEALRKALGHVEFMCELYEGLLLDDLGMICGHCIN